jgi:hypothetical protein
MDPNITKLDKRLALLEQRLDTIQNNHLAHMQEDIDSIKRYFLWGVGVVFVQLIAVIAFLIQNQ